MPSHPDINDSPLVDTRPNIGAMDPWLLEAVAVTLPPQWTHRTRVQRQGTLQPQQDP